MIAIHLIADVGSGGGGWLSSKLIKRGWTVNRGRKTAMLICALAVTPIIFASTVKNLIFGSFFGWLTGLISRVAGPTLFKYMMLGALVGAIIGVLGGFVINNSSAKSRR